MDENLLEEAGWLLSCLGTKEEEEEAPVALFGESLVVPVFEGED